MCWIYIVLNYVMVNKSKLKFIHKSVINEINNSNITNKYGNLNIPLKYWYIRNLGLALPPEDITAPLPMPKVALPYNEQRIYINNNIDIEQLMVN